jgi:hypothetical protein
MDAPYRDKKVVGVFVRFRAPLHGQRGAEYGMLEKYLTNVACIPVASSYQKNLLRITPLEMPQKGFLLFF